MKFEKGNVKIQPPSQAPSGQAAPTPSQVYRPPTGPLKLDYEAMDLAKPYQEPFALGLYGLAGSGKTRLLAHAPGPIGLVPLNRKTIQTVSTTARALGKKVYLPKFELVRSSNPIRAGRLITRCNADTEAVVNIYNEQPWCCAIHNSRWLVDRTKQAALDLYNLQDTKTIGIDGFDILCEDMLIAHFGRTERIMMRDRGAYNKEMIELLGALSGKHLVMTMGAKRIYVNDKPTNDYDWAGWAHLGYHMNLIAEMKVNEKYNNQEDKDEDNWQFALNIVMCQANAAVMGMTGEALLKDDDITFQHLGIRVYPDSEFDDWQ